MVTGITDEIITRSKLKPEKIEEILNNPDTDDFRKATSLLRRAYCPIEAKEYNDKYSKVLTPPVGSIYHKMSDVEEIKKIAYVIHASIMEEIAQWEIDTNNTAVLRKDLANFLGKPITSIQKGKDFPTDATGMKYINKFMKDLMLSTATHANKLGTTERIRNDPEQLWKWIFREIEYHEPTKVNLKRIMRVAQIGDGISVTNFRPLVAFKLYHDLMDTTQDTLIIRDPSCGWLSRMTAAFKIALMYPHKTVKYITTDPNTDIKGKKDEFVKLLISSAGFGYNNNFEVHYYCQGSEVPESRLSDVHGKMSVVGTSPPYGDTEKYNDMDHSVLSPDYYKSEFLIPTLQNIHYDLADNGKVWWNIMNMTTYPNLIKDTLEAFNECGFELIDTLKYKIARVPAIRKTGKPDHEPIFIFKKIG